MNAVDYNLETSVDQREGDEVADAEYDDNLHLWHNKQEPWATLPSGWSYPVQSDTFRHWVTGEFVRGGGGKIIKTKIDAVISDVSARALFGEDGLGAEEHAGHFRLAADADGG